MSNGRPPSRSPSRHPLCEAARSGLYRCEPEALTALRGAAMRLGIVRWRLDLAVPADELAVLGTIARELQFPSWFGLNRDALTDCLLDLSWTAAKGYLLELAHFHTLQTRLPDTAAMLHEVLAHCAEVWAGDGIPFWVLFERNAPVTLSLLDTDGWPA